MIRILIQLFVGLVLLVAPLVSVLAQGLDFDQAQRDQYRKNAHPWTDEKKFKSCGMACQYWRQMEAVSQEIISEHWRNQNIEQSLRAAQGISDRDQRKAEYLRIGRNIAGYCVTGELATPKGVRSCFQRFQVMKEREQMERRQRLGELGQAIQGLKDSDQPVSRKAKAFGLALKPEEKFLEEKKINQASYFSDLEDYRQAYSEYLRRKQQAAGLARQRDLSISEEYVEYLEELQNQKTFAEDPSVGDPLVPFEKVTFDNGEVVYVPKEGALGDLQEIQRNLRETKQAVRELRDDYNDRGAARTLNPVDARQFDPSVAKTSLGRENIEALNMARDQMVRSANQGRQTGIYYDLEQNQYDSTVQRVPAESYVPKALRGQKKETLPVGVQVVEFSGAPQPTKPNKARVELPKPGDKGVFTIVSPDDIDQKILPGYR